MRGSEANVADRRAQTRAERDTRVTAGRTGEEEGRELRGSRCEGGGGGGELRKPQRRVGADLPADFYFLKMTMVVLEL